MIIPTNIHVGFQTRKDTYTGKLAYVVFKDAKGVLRKETSWNSWRDKKIEPEVFDNVPTSGFVLNKKVGETRYGWNPRMAWVRIYDPRGFEFEITVANLLFILEETSSVKGKGLEGEFVYSWDKKDLVLLPVTSQEYVESTNFTSLQTKKVTKDSMKEGRVYINKNKEKVLYLGKNNYYEMQYNGSGGKVQTSKLAHIFYVYDNKKYWVQSGFTNLAEMVSEEIAIDFAEKYEQFKNSIHGTKIVKFEFEKTVNNIMDVLNSSPNNYYGLSKIVKDQKGFMQVRFSKYNGEINTDIYSYNLFLNVGIDNKGNPYYGSVNMGCGRYYLDRKMTEEMVNVLETYSLVGILENGNKINIAV